MITNVERIGSLAFWLQYSSTLTSCWLFLVEQFSSVFFLLHSLSVKLYLLLLILIHTFTRTPPPTQPPPYSQSDSQHLGKFMECEAIYSKCGCPKNLVTEPLRGRKRGLGGRRADDKPAWACFRCKEKKWFKNSAKLFVSSVLSGVTTSCWREGVI